jgi:hypothetical protein
MVNAVRGGVFAGHDFIVYTSVPMPRTLVTWLQLVVLALASLLYLYPPQDLFVDAYFRRPSYPHVFLFGAPKCGTTATFGVLQNHEAFCRPAVKEPSFFGFPDFKKGQKHYYSFFNVTQTKKCNLTLDGTPYFGYMVNAIPNIVHSYKPADLNTKKFIIILREPAKRYFSWYDMIVRMAVLHVKEIVATTKPVQLVDHLGIKYEGYPLSKLCTWSELVLGCRDISNHSRYIQHPEMLFHSFERYYRDHFVKQLKPVCYKIQLQQLWSKVPKKNTFIVNFDTLTANTSAVFEGLSKFLRISNKWNLDLLKSTPSSL